MDIIVIANGTWGRAPNLRKALRNARATKAGAYLVYLATPDTTVTDMGGLSWPSGTEAPRLVAAMRDGYPDVAYLAQA